MLVALTAIAAAVALLLNAAVAGLFFAFSVAVMPALDAIKGEHAIRAMQSINRKILNPVFLIAFMFSPVASAVVGVLLLLLDETEAALLAFAAAVVYGLGVFLTTAAINVPMNNALDLVTPPDDEAEASKTWMAFSSPWTRWNHLRTLTNLLAVVLVGFAMLVWGGQD